MPDSNPRYQKMPRPESIEAFEKYLSPIRVVKSIQQVKPQIFKVDRHDKPEILIYLTNIYIVSEADVYEILSSEPAVNCIVTVSAWNSYTKAAKEKCKQDGIGLFKFKEFMGAVYYDGSQFLDYIHPEDRKRIPH